MPDNDERSKPVNRWMTYQTGEVEGMSHDSLEEARKHVSRLPPEKQSQTRIRPLAVQGELRRADYVWLPGSQELGIIAEVKNDEAIRVRMADHYGQELRWYDIGDLVGPID